LIAEKCAAQHLDLGYRIVHLHMVVVLSVTPRDLVRIGAYQRTTVNVRSSLPPDIFPSSRPTLEWLGGGKVARVTTTKILRLVHLIHLPYRLTMKLITDVFRFPPRSPALFGRLLTPLALLSVLVVAGCGDATPPPAETGAPTQDAIAPWVDYSQRAHHLEAWWDTEAVRANVTIKMGGQTAVDGSTFTFEAHGPRARFDRADGASVIFDGTTAWITPASAEDRRGRFHVLTWPWFIMAPFKMQGEGVTLSDFERKDVAAQEYVTFKQTFAGDMGDTPDDWYRYFIDPETGLVHALSYIVTYGRTAAEANERPSIIRYFDVTSGDGPRISQRYEFWYWDEGNAELPVDGQKGTGTVDELSFPPLDPSWFTIPDDARELTLTSDT